MHSLAKTFKRSALTAPLYRWAMAAGLVPYPNVANAETLAEMMQAITHNPAWVDDCHYFSPRGGIHFARLRDTPRSHSLRATRAALHWAGIHDVGRGDNSTAPYQSTVIDDKSGETEELRVLPVGRRNLEFLRRNAPLVQQVYQERMEKYQRRAACGLDN